MLTPTFPQIYDPKPADFYTIRHIFRRLKESLPQDGSI
jgi:hypothetical protein